MAAIAELNERFGLNGLVVFSEGQGGLIRAQIAGSAATAEVYLQGAHVTAWQPRSAEHPVLYLSPRSQFAPGKAIRGGVPLVFPWFADRADGLPGGMHGFARNLEWEVAAAEERPEGVALSLRLLPNQTTRDLGFDHFVLIYEIVAGDTLSLMLDVENLDDAPLVYAEALHSYFSVSDVRHVEVSGLAGTEYLDRAHAATRHRTGDAPIRFVGETDQLHLNTEAPVTISDAGWERQIVIEKYGSRSTVVWNPAEAKAASLADLGAEAWPHMVCVEPANAAENTITLQPGGLRRMGLVARLQSL